jgi:ABC-2 type transport system ATP-binding protein
VLDIAQLTVPGRLQDLSLALDAGEILAVVGSQGSGKTTLIRALAGLEPIVAGRITFRGQAFHDAVRAGIVGIVLPQQQFPARLRADEILHLFARLRGLGASRIEPLLATLGLQEVARRRFDKLRPGEQARLRLAAALLSDPALLLLDEPIGDVDRESAHILADAIGEVATAGKAVLVTTWGRPDLLALAHRKLYLEDGLLLVPADPATGSTPIEGAPADETEAKRPGAPVTQIAARRDERIFLLDSSEILYAYAEVKSVFVMTAGGSYQVMATLSDLEERLGPAFFRAHKGYLVNLASVREIAAWTRDSFSLILRDGKELPLSKHRAPELRRLLGW